MHRVPALAGTWPGRLFGDAGRKALEWAAIFACIAVIYRGTLVWLVQRWTSPDSYYSHGFLIVPIAACLIWRQRACFKNAGGAGSGTGLILLGAGLLMHLVSRWAGVSFVSGFSLIPVLFGLVLARFGPPAARALLFPIGFLIFMIPLPFVTVVRISFLLKMWSTEWAITWLRWAGLHVVQDGSFIHMNHATLLVGDICSGLRSLVALVCLGALFAYFFRASWWRRLSLFFSAIPVAVMVNAARIAFLCLVAELYGQEIAQGVVHDMSGLLIFALSFFLLGLAREVLEP